jgi:hypothetical protein
MIYLTYLMLCMLLKVLPKGCLNYLDIIPKDHLGIDYAT